MTTYTAIPNGDLDQDSPLTQTLITLLRDNPIAISEGASGAPSLYPGLGANSVLGQVGSYAMLKPSSNTNYTPGDTAAGSLFGYSSAGANTSLTPSGTWRLMGNTAASSGVSSTSIWQRIA